MRIGHEEAVRADACLGSGLECAIDRHVLAEYVVVADRYPGLGPVIPGVLRLPADHRMCVDPVVLPDPAKTTDDRVRTDDSPLVDVHIAFDDRSGPDGNRIMDDCVAGDDRCFMYQRIRHVL